MESIKTLRQSKKIRFSSFIFALALFSAAGCMAIYWLPWMLSPEYCCRPFGTKLEQWRAGHTSPELVILGSSLTLVPAARCDEVNIPTQTSGRSSCLK